MVIVDNLIVCLGDQIASKAKTMVFCGPAMNRERVADRGSSKFNFRLKATVSSSYLMLVAGKRDSV